MGHNFKTFYVIDKDRLTIFFEAMELLQFKNVNLTFHGICIFVSVVYAILSFCDYVKNHDLCEVSFKPFHGNEEMIYPSLTMCLNTPFLEDSFRSYAGSDEIDVSTYESYLLGKFSDVNQTMSKIEYENVSIQATDFILDAYVSYKEQTMPSKKQALDIKTHSWGWMIGFMKCFTFEVPFKKDILVSTMNIRFNNKMFPNGKRPVDGWAPRGLQVFDHYPKQFGRSYASNKRFWKNRYSNTSYRMRFYLKGMEVINRRHKFYDECEDDQPYDDWMVQHVIDIVQCKPPYWTNVDGNFSVCETKEKLAEAAKLFWELFYGTKKAMAPCIEVQKVELGYEETDDEKLGKDETSVKLYFPASSYKEIRQMQAYTMMMLFGNVGGFVGLLLGYALIQFPGFIYASFGIFRRGKNQKRKTEDINKKPKKGVKGMMHRTTKAKDNYETKDHLEQDETCSLPLNEQVQTIKRRLDLFENQLLKGI